MEGGLLSEAEFWSSRQAQLQAARRSIGEQNSGSGISSQRPGLASAMLPEVKRLDNGKVAAILPTSLKRPKGSGVRRHACLAHQRLPEPRRKSHAV